MRALTIRPASITRIWSAWRMVEESVGNHDMAGTADRSSLRAACVRLVGGIQCGRGLVQDDHAYRRANAVVAMVEALTLTTGQPVTALSTTVSRPSGGIRSRASPRAAVRRRHQGPHRWIRPSQGQVPPRIVSWRQVAVTMPTVSRREFERGLADILATQADSAGIDVVQAGHELGDRGFTGP